MLCNIFKERESMRTRKHTYLKKKKQPRKTTNCSRLVYVVSVTNVLEEIMQLMESQPSQQCQVKTALLMPFQQTVWKAEPRGWMGTHI